MEDLFSPSPRETITTMEATPMVTPSTVRIVRIFRFRRLLLLNLSKSKNFINLYPYQ